MFHSLLLLIILRLKSSFAVDLRDCAFDGLKSGVLVLLVGLHDTAACNTMQKRVEFHFSLESYALLRQIFCELRSNTIAILSPTFNNIVSFSFITRIPDIHIIKENNTLYY